MESHSGLALQPPRTIKRQAAPKTDRWQQSIRRPLQVDDVMTIKLKTHCSRRAATTGRAILEASRDLGHGTNNFFLCLYQDGRFREARRCGAVGRCT